MNILLIENEPLSTHERPGNWYEVTEAVIWKFRKGILSRFCTKLREVRHTEADLTGAASLTVTF